MLHCANCENAKVFFTTDTQKRPIHRVRCAKGHWRGTRTGNERFYTMVGIKKVHPPGWSSCPDFGSMGDEVPLFVEEFIESLPPDLDQYRAIWLGWTDPSSFVSL